MKHASNTSSSKGLVTQERRQRERRRTYTDEAELSKENTTVMSTFNSLAASMGKSMHDGATKVVKSVDNFRRRRSFANGNLDDLNTKCTDDLESLEAGLKETGCVSPNSYTIVKRTDAMPKKKGLSNRDVNTIQH
jgi:hypothetical protein